MPATPVATIAIPEQIGLDLRLPLGQIRQLNHAAGPLDSPLTNFTFNTISGQIFTRASGSRVLIVERRVNPPSTVDEVLLLPQGQPGQWLKPIPTTEVRVIGGSPSRASIAANSWAAQFSYVEERSISDTILPGLRPPQIGALYATLAHWKVTDEPANIVMPTGTGKTETMLAILAKERLPKLLVVVPTDVLREQLSHKFQSWGLLRKFGVVGTTARFPVVGTLKKIPSSVADLNSFFDQCNVVVTTMAIAGRAPELIQSALAAACSHLFIDEAHHIKAPTWDAFKVRFAGKPILQFTATPFRNDGKLVDGKPIFTYPLRKAQAEGYFRPIKFKPIVEGFTSLADVQIAAKAVEQLRADLASGLDHLVMARTEDIKRATDVHAIYKAAAADLNPLLLHSRLTRADAKHALNAIHNRASRIIVCVDMLGEGFDLPQLKIAAIHDVHKSLAVTLQFIGRFTRTLSEVGDATAIANIAAPGVEGSLRTLYAEDSDWNQLLQVLADDRTAREAKRAEFLAEFNAEKIVVPIQNIMPKMSTMIYKVNCSDWDLVDLERIANRMGLFGSLIVNQRRKVALFVIRAVDPVEWGAVRELSNTAWHLYIVHWDAARNLLFIHTSDKDSGLDPIAAATAGTSAELISGEPVFRVFHNFKRLMLMNLGLNHSLSRAVRFTMFVGADIVEALSQAQQEGRIKSNTFGRGYEEGEKATVGCSHRGRIWSYQAAPDISAWVDWCHSIADKVLDSSISFDRNILPYLTILRDITSRPNRIPIMIDWWEGLLRRSEDYVSISFGDQAISFLDVGLDLVNRKDTGNLSFRVFAEREEHRYEVIFVGDKINYRPLDGDLTINFGRRSSLRLSDYFQKEPPVIYFDNGGFLIYNRYAEVKLADNPPFDPARIECWDWTGTDIRVESQRQERRTNSIQYRVIQTILSPSWDVDYDVVLDDDAANEAADIVALKADGEDLLIHLFHCKFSSEVSPRGRVEDLHEVCGQAQRSARWRHDVDQLLRRSLRRDANRVVSGRRTGFEKGTKEALAGLQNRSRLLKPKLTIFIVQPGLAKSQISNNQRELLATTETYLKDISHSGFRVIASP